MPRKGKALQDATKRDRRQAEDRRRLLAGLRLAGVYDQGALAAQFEVSRSTISRDFDILDREFRAAAVRDTERHVTLDLLRIEKLIENLWAAAGAGSIAAADQITKLLARKAAMLGLDAPKKIAPTTPDGERQYAPPVRTITAVISPAVAAEEGWLDVAPDGTVQLRPPLPAPYLNGHSAAATGATAHPEETEEDE